MSADNKPTSRILVVLPESAPTKELVAFLEHQGFEVMWAREGQNGYEIIDTEAPDALIADLRDSRIDGLRLLQVARQRNSEICAILVGGPAEIELGVEAMRMGAYDFQVQPLNLAKIRAVLDRGISHQRLVGEVTSLQRRLDERYRLGGIARRSSRWQRIYSQIEQVARSKASVLITGETGTGKGEVAKAIHQQSRRRENPFVEISCGALPEGIVESELFGHEKGAFTGAAMARKGRFELADQGTLFLDEVGDLPLATQVKLLRAIQSGEFERVGGVQTRKVDARIIAATNRNLEEMVEQGTYRADLFYRLKVVAIEVPPLRECREDIPILVDMFTHQFARENGVKLGGVAPEALDVLMAYEWPGNVRELKNCIEGMVVMGPRQGLLKVGDIPRHIRKKAPEASELLFRPGMSLEELEKVAIEETLKAVNFDRRQAARLLGIGLSTLYRKEKEYGLRP
ncbi:MAG: sigma-54-dependent Fis family transcriptional regulator [Candidatus Latescibacteria bacterium]|nr:sigma-54-dependent Fis family transcriptional regulator [Candidatus Latescibacterota bacterium]